MDEMQKNERHQNRHEIMKLRQGMYGFFACSLNAPLTAETVRPFLAENAPEEGAEGSAAALAVALEEMRGYGEAEWRQLAAEYRRLFPESGPMPVHPWESVYRSAEHVLFDEHTLDVKERMAAWGLAPAARERVPADHIGLECGFLASLSQRAALDMERGDEASARENAKAQLAFLREHLLVWAGAFCSDLKRQARMDFYRSLPDVLEEWLQQDAMILEKIFS